MIVGLRVDSSLELGTGHVVRCLALAEALRARGATCRFLTASLTESLERAILAAGHHVVHLGAGGWSAPLSGLGWSKERQLADAEASAEASPGASWMVVDHYGLDAAWETRVRALGQKCLVVDDLARLHDCDILLDQTLHADAASRYARSSCAHKLLGPRFALLRPGFAAAHRDARIRVGPVRRLFVMMSGSDANNVTGLALDAVAQAGLRQLALDIVIGSSHPQLDALRARVAAEGSWTLHVDSDRVAELMLAADLAIGAGGTATWERCALGLPALAVEIAANQHELLREGAQAGLLHMVPGPPDAARLAAHLRVMAESDGLRAHISQQGVAAVDGRGALRVAAAMDITDIRVRRARAEDRDDLLAWRNAPAVRDSSRNPEVIGADAHRSWFQSVLGSSDCLLLVGERSSGAVGVVRFDRLGRDSAEVSIYLAPGAQPGDGSPLLGAAEDWLRASAPEIRSVIAEILPGNRRSEDLFARAGYRPLRSVHIKELA